MGRVRDPARIDPVLDAVREAWASNPDIRLGQLIYNAVRSVKMETAVPPCPPLYYIEDDALVEGLNAQNRPPLSRS